MIATASTSPTSTSPLQPGYRERCLSQIVVEKRLSANRYKQEFISATNLGGRLHTRKNDGVALSLDGNVKNLAIAPQSMGFQIKISCDHLPALRNDSLKQVFDDITKDIVHHLNSKKVEALPGLANEKAVEHLIEPHMLHYRNK